MMGGIDASQFFNDPTKAAEAEIRRLSDSLVSRIDWSFMLQPKDNVMSMEWSPERGYGPARWVGYNEASCLYLLGLGAKTNALPPTFWERWTKGYQWTKYHDYNFVTEPSLFTHQYSQVRSTFAASPTAICAKSKATTLVAPGRLHNGIMPHSIQRLSELQHQRMGLHSVRRTWKKQRNDLPWILGSWSSQWIRRWNHSANRGRRFPPFAPDICLAALRHFYDSYRTNLWTTEVSVMRITCGRLVGAT
jgi:hypothetical protein